MEVYSKFSRGNITLELISDPNADDANEFKILTWDEDVLVAMYGYDNWENARAHFDFIQDSYSK